jgi:hypothetical protein
MGDGLRLEGSSLNALNVIVNGKKSVNFATQVTNGCIEIKSEMFAANTSVEILFAWDAYCKVNLYNSIGLAAKPFKIMLNED